MPGSILRQVSANDGSGVRVFPLVGVSTVIMCFGLPIHRGVSRLAKFCKLRNDNWNKFNSNITIYYLAITIYQTLATLKFREIQRFKCFSRAVDIHNDFRRWDTVACFLLLIIGQTLLQLKVRNSHQVIINFFLPNPVALSTVPGTSLPAFPKAESNIGAVIKRHLHIPR